MDVVNFRNAVNVLLEDAGKHRSEDAAESWQGLVQLIQSNSQIEEDAAYVASVLLAPKDSLLQFLVKSLEQQGKAGSKVREAIFKYLERFLKELGPDRAHKYCAQIIATCLFAYKREDSNPAKGATFLPLQCILDWDVSVPDDHTASELARVYQSSYQRLKSLTGTVKGDILQTLGQLLQASPQGVAQASGFDHRWLLNECTLVLQTQSKAIKPDQGYVAGALAGLSSALAQCQGSESLEAEETAYYHIKKTIQDVQNLSRYHGLRAAMSMLAFQADRFQQHLVEDGTDIINKLTSIKTQHANKDVRERADQALSAVLHQLSEKMMGQAQGQELEQLQALHRRLLGQLTQVLSSPHTSSRETAVAVAGIGHLAPPTRRFFGQQGVTQLLRHLTPLVQQGNLVEQLEDVIDDKIRNEVVLLAAFARVLGELDTIEEEVVQQCLHIIERLVQSYRGLWPKQRLPVHSALSILLSALRPKQAVLQSMLPRLVSVVLTYTLKPADNNLIAGPLAAAANQNEDVEEPWSTYLHLWHAILQLDPPDAPTLTSNTPNQPHTLSKTHNSTNRDRGRAAATRAASGPRASSGSKIGLDAVEGSPEQVAAEQQALYDGLLQAVLDGVRNLDLEYHQAQNGAVVDAAQKLNSPDTKTALRQETDPTSDPISADIGSGLTARNLRDMRAFINLADFTCALLPACGAPMFKGWAYLVTLELVAASGQRPLLSGFYRMLTVCMRLTSATGILHSPASGSQDEEVAGGICLQVYQETLKGVVTACRRYKDELLEACLQLVLSAPTPVMTIHELVGPLQTALSLGLQYPPLAAAAIAAMERWETEQPQALKAAAPQVVPLLDPYLLEVTGLVPGSDAVAVIAEDELEEAEEAAKEADEQALQGEASGKDNYKRIQAASTAAVQSQKASRMQGLKSLQPRIQAWLGRCADTADALAVKPLEQQAASGGTPRWDPDNKLGLTVPLPEDQSLVVWLDKALPQVSELAENAADRTKRVAACEFLHAITLWMIGVNARRPEGSKEADFDAPPTQFHAIMQKLFPVLLSLACAAEPVSRQLFEPLVMSLVHWLTRSARRESAETIVLLEAILDGLSDEKSGDKRDLCANAAREFLVWSAKHIPMPKGRDGGLAPSSNRASSSLNAASLLRRLFERLAHPQAYQRLGAAQAMARCADAMGKLSDLNDVSDAFYLEALCKCVAALRAAEHDAEGTGTKGQVADALAALVKVPLRRVRLAESIKQPRVDRQGFVDLAAFLEWLWNLTVVPERYCRQMCMWLMDKLATLQMEDAMQTDDDQAAVALWCDWHHQQQTSTKKSEAVQRFLTVHVTLRGGEGEESMSLSCLRHWLQAVEACLSWASWALDQGLITTSELHLAAPSGTKPTTPQSTSTEGEQGEQACVTALLEFLGMVPELTEASEEDAAGSVLAGCENDCKHLAFKALTFLQQVLEDEVFPEASPAVHNFVLAALVAPSHLGIPPPDAHSARKLAIKAKELIEQAVQKRPALLKPLQHRMATYLSAVTGAEGQGRLLVSKGQGVWEWGVDLPAAATLVQGLTLAADPNLPKGVHLIPASFKADLPHKLLSLAEGLQHNAPPQHHLAAEGALNLALRMGIAPDVVMDWLLGPSKVVNLYEAYRPVIHTWLIFNASACAGKLFEALAGMQSPSQHAQRAQRTAGLILNGCLVSLQRSRDAQAGRADIRQRSFLDAVLPHVTKLAPLLAGPTSSTTAEPSTSPPPSNPPSNPPSSEGAAAAKLSLLHLMARLLSLDAQRVLLHNPSQHSSGFLFSSYCSFLTARSSTAADVQLRAEALQLLHHFLALPAGRLEELSQHIEELANNMFPASSWEWKPGSTQSTDYARQLMALMDSMVAAAEQGLSVEPILQAILPVVREMGEKKGHVRQDALVTRLTLVAAAPWKMLSSRMSPNAQTPPSTPRTKTQVQHAPEASQQARSLLQYAWKHVFDTPGLPSALRRAFLHFILLPSLRYSPIPFQQSVLQERAAALLAILNSTAAGAADRLDEEGQLLARTAAYTLVQYVYEHMPPEEVKSHILGPAGGDQVNMRVLKAATNDIRGLVPQTDAGLEEIAREARCAAFACGAALVVTTQEKENIFAILLKDPKSADPAGPFKQLIEASEELNFAVEADDSRRAAFKRASTSVKAVAERIRADRHAAASLAATGTLGFAGSIGAFSSQGPSLSAKVSASQFSLGDGSASDSQAGFVSSVDDVYQQSLSMGATQSMSDWQDDAADTLLMGQPEDGLSVEDDDLDRHDCMMPLIHLVEKAATLFQASHTGGGGGMPEWMKRMHAIVEASEARRAVRLFLVKVVVHVERRHAEREATGQQAANSPGPASPQAASNETSPGVFGQFGKEWFPAMISAVIGSAEEAAQQGVHYLLLDVCLTCLKWPSIFPAQHRGATPGLPAGVRLAADALMDYLVRAAYNPQRPVVNNNFNLIKAFIHHWRAAVPLPLPALLSLLGALPAKPSSGAPDARAKRRAAEQRCVAMKLLAAGLVYGQAEPLMTNPDFKTAVKHVVDCVATKGGQTLAQQSGECMGVILAQHYRKSKAGLHIQFGRTSEQLEKEVKQVLLGIHSKGEHDRFIYTVERLTSFHVALIDSLRAPLLNALPQVTGMQQALLLDILQRRAAKLTNLMTDIKPVLSSLLASHNHALQNNALQLLKVLLPAETDETAGKLLQQLTQSFTDHSSSDCRQQHFEILRSAWQLRPAMHAALRPALLSMLGDADPTIRGQALEFWDSALPKHFGLRLQALLQDSLTNAGLLREQLERQWTQSAAALLLELPKGQRIYSAAIFDRELAECKFAEYPIDTYGKATLGMAPLFSSQWSSSQDSSQSQGMLGTAPGADPKSPGFGATQFTQAAAGMVRATQGATVAQSASLALSMPRQDLASVVFSQGSSTSSSSSSDTLSDHAVVRRRFGRPAGRTNEILGRLQRRRAAAGAQALARERKVNLMRKYRTGELPDVQQLSIAAFLAPLGVMASRDPNIAQITVEAVWRSVCDAAAEDPKGGVPPTPLEGLRSALSQCFEQQPRQSGYVGCLQSLALADRGGCVSVKLAAEAAQASGRLQAGALQIEEQMLFGMEPEASGPKSKRRAVGNRTQGSSTGGSHPMEPSRKADAPSWGALAEVYAQLGQDDLVQVIYAKCLSRCPGSEVAMQALTQRKVDFAFRVYQALLGGAAGGDEAQAMDTDTQGAEQGLDVTKLMGGAQPLKEEEDMWFRQQNRCMESLGMWEDVLSIVDDETGNDESRLFVQDDNWDGGQYLRPFVRACLFQPMERCRLSQLIQQAATDSHMSGMLESTSAVEIAAQAAISRQWDRCQALVSRGWGVFREKWGGLHPLSRARRLQTLASLQPLAEMQAIVSLVASLPAGAVAVEGLQKQVEGWCQRWPSVQQPSANACLTVIHVRGLLLDALMQEWPREQQHAGQSLFQVLQGFQGEVVLGGAACLARQGFLDTAQDLLTQHRAAVGKGHLPSLKAQLRLRIAQVDANPATEWLYKDLAMELQQLEKMHLRESKVTQGKDASPQCQMLLLQAEAHQCLSRQPSDTDRSKELSAALQLYQQAAAVKLGGSQLPEPEGSQSAVAEASLKLALLCNELLQDQSTAGAVKIQQGRLDAMLVRHMMQAMRLGGKSGQEAQLYVPRILSVLGSSKEARQCFTEVWTSVPLHVLLPWAAQMLSLLDAPQGEALLPAIQALAKQFPQQLYFPFRLSKGHYGPDGQGRASSLQPLLNSPLMEEWGAALNDTTYPAQRWEGWVGRLSSLVAAGDKAAARELFKDEVYPDMITNHLRGGRAASRASGSKGPPATVNSAFAAKWDNKFKDVFGAAGDKLSGVSARDFEGQCARLAQGIKQETDQVTGKRDLARLSSWFEGFSQRAGTAEEEHRLVMPHMPNVHSSQAGLPPKFVVGFGKMVDVFSSKQRPKKLTIYGDDFKKYEWIVKGGEEVRIDQRIEQLFDVMNGLMQRQPGAAAHSLQVHTYDVVPISSSLGMVAFVAGTKPLKALLTDPALMSPEAVAAADNRYSTFILTKGGNLERAGSRYERMFRSASRKETVANLQAVQSHLRWDSLREGLIRAAGGPEVFLSMRAAYTSSLAAVSIAGYVAGAGDRHTDNFLMDLSSGTLVPIDFGYSFGTAVQVLPIPELMPFRLTRQMAGVLQPHDALALLQAPCTLAMTALRSGKDILEGIMGVFMREPLLDWQREARVLSTKRSAASSAKDPFSAADTVDPQDMHINLKVDNALQKLLGKHPADIMLLELSAKHANGAHWKALQAIVKGDESHNVRTKIAGDDLTVEDQVRCLLDQATDPNILGRTWQGWKPYL